MDVVGTMAAYLPVVRVCAVWVEKSVSKGKKQKLIS
jgi:hypothetical protein